MKSALWKGSALGVLLAVVILALSPVTLTFFENTVICIVMAFSGQLFESIIAKKND